MSIQNVDIFSVLLPEMVVPTVQLRHDLPDGSWHVDWMISPDKAGCNPLITFRLPDLLTNLTANSPDSLLVERLSDHRSQYLEYEGPISGNRGNVTRISTGKAEIESNTGDSLLLRCIWEDTAQTTPLINLRPDSKKHGKWLVDFTGK